MKVAELRDLDVEVLRQRTTEIDDQLFRMRIQKSMGQLEAPGKVKQVRRDRARILTILKEKAK
jgi:large subunit ribosomal protein L29